MASNRGALHLIPSIVRVGPDLVGRKQRVTARATGFSQPFPHQFTARPPGAHRASLSLGAWRTPAARCATGCWRRPSGRRCGCFTAPAEARRRWCGSTWRRSVTRSARRRGSPCWSRRRPGSGGGSIATATRSGGTLRCLRSDYVRWRPRHRRPRARCHQPRQAAGAASAGRSSRALLRGGGGRAGAGGRVADGGDGSARVRAARGRAGGGAPTGVVAARVAGGPRRRAPPRARLPRVTRSPAGRWRGAGAVRAGGAHRCIERRLGVAGAVGLLAWGGWSWLRDTLVSFIWPSPTDAVT